jgi:hypothetical protein
MELKLEEVCVGHIQSRNGNCSTCRMDEYNFNCPNYLSQKDAIKLYRPEQVPSPREFFSSIN